MPEVGHRLHASLQRFLGFTVDREHTDAAEDADQSEGGVLGAYHHQVVLAWELVGERGMSAAKKKRGAEAKQQLRRK